MQSVRSFNSLFFHPDLNLTLNAPIATKVVCLSRLLKYLRNLYGKQCGPRSDCSCSGYTLFTSILNSSVMLGNYLQQTTSADDNFRCIFSWRFRVKIRVKMNVKNVLDVIIVVKMNDKVSWL